MASARELLEQADALMRRNRGRSSGVDIPVLTDVVAGVPANDEPDADVPVLTEVVEAGAVDAADLQPAMIAPMPLEPPQAQHAPPPQADQVAIRQSADAIPVALPMDGDTSDWLVMDTIDPSMHSITGPGPDTLAVVPPVTLKAEPEPKPEPKPELEPELEPESPPAAAAGPIAVAVDDSPAPAPVVVDDSAERAAKAAAEEERWRALAEQVSMQVLQRVDLFTDTGLKTQLAGHLQPIVERASAELVRAITEQVGGVLRTYVAEAIEREIALWRRDH